MRNFQFMEEDRAGEQCRPKNRPMELLTRYHENRILSERHPSTSPGDEFYSQSWSMAEELPTMLTLFTRTKATATVRGHRGSSTVPIHRCEPRLDRDSRQNEPCVILLGPSNVEPEWHDHNAVRRA